MINLKKVSESEHASKKCNCCCNDSEFVVSFGKDKKEILISLCENCMIDLSNTIVADYCLS